MAEMNGGGEAKKTDLVRQSAGLDVAVWSDQRILTIWKMAAPKAQNTEQLAAFLTICNRYDLDPLLGEAWFGEVDGKPSVITGRDSYLKTAQREPTYLGYVADVVREADEYGVTRTDSEIVVHHQKVGFARGKILGAYCVVYDAERKPVIFEAHFEEYSHLHSRRAWKQNPSDMILTRALTTAHRLMYRLSGLYTPGDGGTLPDEGPSEVRQAEEARQPLNDLRARTAGAAAAPAATESIPEAEWEPPGEAEEGDASSPAFLGDSGDLFPDDIHEEP